MPDICKRLRELPYPLVLAALGPIVMGCGENVLGPLDDTTFVLRSVDGAPLPAAVEGKFGNGWTVIADTIRLSSGDDWDRHIVYVQRNPGGSEIPRDWERDGFVTRRGTEVVLDLECNDTGDCQIPDRLVPVGDRLEMSQTLFHGGTNLVFERLR